MKFYLRAVSLLLVVLMAAAALVSCGNTGTETDTTAAAVATTSPVAAETTEPDPFAGVTFNGIDFNFLAWEQSTVEYDVEEESGDMIENAVYKRNREVEDRLGVKLKYDIMKGNSSSFKDFCQTATTAIQSGSHSWDCIACYTRAATLLTMNGVLSDLLTTDYLDFSQPCWPESLTKLNTIGGSLYFASGDIATSILYQMQFMAVNNDFAASLNLTGIQEKALEGKWTLDYMLELTKGVYSSDGNGRSADCKYGMFIYSHTFLDTFYLGAGLNYVDVDSEGNAKISDDLSSDASYAIQEKLRHLFWDGDTADGYYCTSSSEMQSMITAGNCLLYVVDGLRLTQYLSQSTYSYSILPAPKYSEDQDQYYTAVGFPHSMYCIPTDANDIRMSSAVMELMAETSYSDVSTVIFDTAFKYRYSQGSGDVQIFDVIRAGIVFDLGRTLFDQLGGDTSGPVRKWRDACTSLTASFTTVVKSLSKNWTKQLGTSIDKIKSYGAAQ